MSMSINKLQLKISETKSQISQPSDLLLKCNGPVQLLLPKQSMLVIIDMFSSFTHYVYSYTTITYYNYD